MPDASVTDSDGCTIKLHTSRGLVLSGPMGMEKRYEELQEFSAKEDDVLVCGYQKCGTVKWRAPFVSIFHRINTCVSVACVTA